jgi:hypothetical protein
MHKLIRAPLVEAQIVKANPSLIGEEEPQAVYLTLIYNLISGSIPHSLDITFDVKHAKLV